MTTSSLDPTDLTHRAGGYLHLIREEHGWWSVRLDGVRRWFGIRHVTSGKRNPELADLVGNSVRDRVLAELGPDHESFR